MQKHVLEAENGSAAQVGTSLHCGVRLKMYELHGLTPSMLAQAGKMFPSHTHPQTRSSNPYPTDIGTSHLILAHLQAPQPAPRPVRLAVYNKTYARPWQARQGIDMDSSADEGLGLKAPMPIVLTTGHP